MAFLSNLFGRGGTRFVGIDFGSFELKACEFSPSPRGPVLDHVHKIPTPLNSIRDGVVIDTPMVGDAIRQLMADGPFTSKGTVTAVAGPSVVVRQVSLPVMSERELRESIKFEAERFLPYSIDEAQLDAKILGKNADGQNMDVLIVAAQKDLVMSQAAALQYAGLTPQIVEVEPFSMVRALLSPNDPRYDQNTAIINVGASSTSINITKSGFVPFTRNVAIGGNQLTRAISTGLNVSLEEAEMMKRDKAQILSQRDTEPVPPAVSRIFNVITPPLTELVTEIHKSIDYFRTRFRGENIETVFLGGGTAHLKNLDAFLSHELGIPVSLADPLANAVFNPADFPPDYLKDLAPALIVAAGLARRNLVPETGRVTAQA